MQFDPHFLLAKTSSPTETQSAIKNLISLIKQNQTVRKGIDLVYFLPKPLIKLPRVKSEITNEAPKQTYKEKNREDTRDDDIQENKNKRKHNDNEDNSINDGRTKWERFAEKKGIEKKRKSFFIVDEESGVKRHRYGAMSAKNLEMRSGIYSEGMSYSKLRREKEKRVGKNMESMKKNKERVEKAKEEKSVKKTNK